MSEYFDKVDHNDQVIGKVSRKQAHQFNLMHRAVHIFLQDQQGKWLLQKRSAKKDVDPLLWTTSCSGHVDSGESYLDAAIRECDEELGLRISSRDLTEIFRCSPCKETGMEFVRVYFMDKVFHQLSPSPKEIEKLHFYKLDDLLNKCTNHETEFSVSFLHIFRLVQWKLHNYSKDS